jgi:hypothetical protein
MVDWQYHVKTNQHTKLLPPLAAKAKAPSMPAGQPGQPTMLHEKSSTKRHKPELPIKRHHNARKILIKSWCLQLRHGHTTRATVPYQK